MDLWKGREDLRPVSSMTFDGGYDMKVYDLSYSCPSYWGWIEQDEIVGVYSVHMVNKIEGRSRGIWVHPDYRKQGIAGKLIHETVNWSRNHDLKFTWAFPRKTTLPIFEREGFAKTSDWIGDVPNCYVRKELC